MLADENPDALEVRLVLEAIQSRYGYDFRGYSPSSISRRVLAAAAQAGVSHLGELQHRLIHDPVFFEGILDTLTVRVTEMFRDPSFYRVFRERVVPILRTYPELKLWHAGCASGEEVYASAILLSEEGLYERAQIYATDMSRVAIDQARAGVYPLSRLPVFAHNHAEGGGRQPFDAYWSEAYDRITIRETLRKNVHFFQHDLVSDYTLGEMHVIFCRNVLIYFGPQLRERVFAIFANSLRPGSFLCLGNSEALPEGQRGSYEPFSSIERVFQRVRPA